LVIEKKPWLLSASDSKEVARASPFSISIKESSGMLFVVFISNKKGGIKPPLNYISIIRIYI
jgi:hypothetical protein